MDKLGLIFIISVSLTAAMFLPDSRASGPTPPPAVAQFGSVIAGDCVSWKSAGYVQDAGGGCGNANSNYFFHGFAGQQILGDPVFYDISGALDNGAFGANLSNAAAWAASGYVSTLLPIGGSTNSVIRMPALNYDFLGGQTVIIWWLGKVATPVSNSAFIGDGYGTTYPGIRIRADSTAKFDFILSSSTTQIFTGSSTSTPFDGTLHSFALVINGPGVSYGEWVDEVYDPALGGVYSQLNSGTAIDTRTSNTFNIGSSAPNAAAQTDGIASATRAFVVIRLPAGTSPPSVTTMTGIFQQLRANPARLISNTAFR